MRAADRFCAGGLRIAENVLSTVLQATLATLDWVSQRRGYRPDADMFYDDEAGMFCDDEAVDAHLAKDVIDAAMVDWARLGVPPVSSRSVVRTLLCYLMSRSDEALRARLLYAVFANRTLERAAAELRCEHFMAIDGSWDVSPALGETLASLPCKVIEGFDTARLRREAKNLERRRR